MQEDIASSYRDFLMSRPSNRYRIIDILRALINPEQKRFVAMNIFGDLISAQGFLCKLSSALRAKTYISSGIVCLGSSDKTKAIDRYQIDYGFPIFADFDARFELRSILKAIDAPQEKSCKTTNFYRITLLCVLIFLTSFIPTLFPFLVKAFTTKIPLGQIIFTTGLTILLSFLACFIIYLLLRVIPVRIISDKSQQEIDNTILEEIYRLSISSTESWGPLADKVFQQASSLLSEETKLKLQSPQTPQICDQSIFDVEVGPAEKIVRLASTYYQRELTRMQNNPSYKGPEPWVTSYKDLSRWACAKAAEYLEIKTDGSGAPSNSISDSLRKCCESIVGSADREHAQQHIQK